jgi:5'-nucleotidase
MRILVTNDDGIHAPGLTVLEEIARVLSDPLRLREVSPRHYAVKGTPTDCVIMGARHVISEPGPDLVLSGVNRGQNAAEDVTYSGTIAGAMEGTILGIPSMALSQAYGPSTRERPHWDTAIRHAPDLIRRVLAAGMPRDVLVNINFPDCAPDEVKGIAITMQGKRDQDLLRVDARHDGRGNPYYWLAFARRERRNLGIGTDLAAIAENRIAVTPLRLNLTDEPFMTRLAEELDDASIGR